MESPRNLREWQQTVERNLKQAKRSASVLALAHAQKESAKVTKELQQFKDLTPAAPVELSYQTSIYVSTTTKELRARLAVEFADVTKATNGEDITVATYELAVRRIGMGTEHSAYPLQLLPGQSYPGTPGWNKAPVAEEYSVVATSPESEFLVSDLLPSGAYTFKVRAAAGSFIKPGLWSSERTAHLEPDETPPPQPTAPIATVSRGVITVEWDGLSVSGDMPADFSYVELAQGEQSSPTERVAVFREAGFTVISGVPYNTPQFFRLRAFDLSGNPSLWSVQATATTQPLVDTDVILSQIDAAETEIINVGQAALTSGQLLDAKLSEADSSLASHNDRITDAEADLTDAFGQLGTVDSRIDTAKTSTLTAAASDAQAKADTALASANAQVAQVVARGTSQVRNGSFEYNLDGWTVAGDTVIDSTLARTGTRSMRIGPSTINRFPFSEYVASATGRIYYMEMWVRRSGAEVKSLGVGFAIGIPGQSTATAGRVDSNAISDTTFTKVTATFTVTATSANSIRFAPWIAASTNLYYIDDFLVVDITEAQNALTAANNAQGAANAAQAAAGSAQSTANDAMTAAGTKNAVYYSLDAPSGTGTKTGDLWRQRNATNEIIAEWQWSGTAWVKQTVSGSNVSNMDIGFLTAGSATMSQALINKLVAGTANFQTVDVKNLFATSGTMQQATIDKLWADVVRSKKITTDMMVVGRGANLIYDEFFDDAATKTYRNTAAGAWGAWGRNATINLNWYGGTVSAGSARNFYFDTLAANDKNSYIAVEPGQQFRFTAQYTSSVSGPRATMRMVMRDGTAVYTSGNFTTTAGGSNVYDPAGSIRTFERIFTVPADVTHIMPALQFEATCTSAYVYGGATLVNMATGKLIVDGSVLTKHLTVTEDMTVKLLEAHKVAAGELAANAVEADNIKAGAVSAAKLEAQLALVTEIIAGNPAGTHARMDANGFRVFAAGDEGALPYETVRMGVAATDDLFSITSATGDTVVSIDSMGTIAGRSVEASNSLYYKGIELDTRLNAMPQGMAAWGQIPINSNMSSNGEVGLFEIGWDTSLDNPARMYEFNVNPFIINQTAAGIVGLRLRYTTDGSVPTINSPLIGYSYFHSASAGLVSTGQFTRIIGSNNGPYIRVLLTLYDSTTGIAEVWSGTGQSHLYCTVKDLGATIPGTASATTGGGTPYTGSTVAAPTNPVVTKTVEYGYYNVRSYLPSGAQYNYNTSKAYQGLSPAGVGNLSSMYGFNQNFASILSGATINDIWVYLYFEHWYYNGGGTARIRLHNNLTAPTTNVGLTASGIDSGSWPKAAGRWVRLPDSLYAGFQSGAYKGFGLVGDGTYTTYGYANNGRLKIKYTK